MAPKKAPTMNFSVAVKKNGLRYGKTEQATILREMEENGYSVSDTASYFKRSYQQVINWRRNHKGKKKVDLSAFTEAVRALVEQKTALMKQVAEIDEQLNSLKGLFGVETPKRRVTDYVANEEREAEFDRMAQEEDEEGEGFVEQVKKSKRTRAR